MIEGLLRLFSGLTMFSLEQFASATVFDQAWVKALVLDDTA